MSIKALLSLSGGLDSLSCLAIALEQGYDVHTVSFYYGQRHQVELEAAQNIAQHYKVPHQLVDLSFLGKLKGSALTNDQIAVPEYDGGSSIPDTYVPSRNIIFLSVLSSMAETLGAEKIIIGASSIDYSGYPDCRPEFFQAFQQTLDLGTKTGVEDKGISIETPLIDLSKAQTIEKGVALGVDYSMSISCYSANARGEACGKCDSCYLRKKGFQDAGIADPTRYIKHNISVQ